MVLRLVKDSATGQINSRDVKARVTVKLSDSKVPDLRHGNTRFPADSAVWGGLGDTALL